MRNQNQNLYNNNNYSNTGNPYSNNPNPYSNYNPYGNNNQSPRVNNSFNQNNYNQNSPSNQAYAALNTMGQARTNNLDFNRNQEIINNPDYFYDDKSLGGDLYADSRAGFVRKVYTLLSIQLIITVLICVWAMNSPTFKNMFVNTPAIIILSVLLMVMSCVIGCFLTTTRKYGLPILLVFTLIFSLLVGIICASTQPRIVTLAAGITAAVVIALTIYSCVTKTDLTGCGPYLFIFLLIMFIFGIVCIFWRNPIVQLVYACLAALLYGIYLIFDTQMVLGKFQNAYSLDDAYFAAIQLYIDIIEIFLQILRILSYANN